MGRGNFTSHTDEGRQAETFVASHILAAWCTTLSGALLGDGVKLAAIHHRSAGFSLHRLHERVGQIGIKIQFVLSLFTGCFFLGAERFN